MELLCQYYKRNLQCLQLGVYNGMTGGLARPWVSFHSAGPGFKVHKYAFKFTLKKLKVKEKKTTDFHLSKTPFSLDPITYRYIIF